MTSFRCVVRCAVLLGTLECQCTGDREAGSPWLASIRSKVKDAEEEDAEEDYFYDEL